MFCKSCGQQMDDYLMACPKCGAQNTTNASQTLPPQYQPPPVVFQQNTYTPQQEMAPVVSIGDYMGMMILPSLLSMVTCGIGGLILLLVWAFGGNVNPNKQNFSKATLIFMLIYSIIVILPFLLFLFVFGGLAYFQNMQYYLAFNLF